MSKKQSAGTVGFSRGDRIFFGFNHVLMVFLAAITLYPILYVVFCSFSDPVEFARVRGMLMHPAGFSFEGYSMVFKMSNIWLGYRNTIMYVVLGTALAMVLIILGAYILSHNDFLLKKPVMFFIVFTMYFNGGMIPTYLCINALGMNNTIWAVLMPGLVSVYHMIVLRTSFNSIPRALIESATIDGAGDGVVLFRIVLPLSGAALATITLFNAVGWWGAWYNAMIFLQKRRDLYTLQLFLRELLILDTGNEGFLQSQTGSTATRYLVKEIVKYCIIVVATIPVLVVYPFVQQYFVKGVMVGAIKE